MTGHPIDHLELSATDPAAASRFYAELFGWKIVHNAQFNYYIFEGEGGPRGGFVSVDGIQHRAGDVLIYFGTDDIDATLKNVEALGGRVLQPKTEIPGIAWYALFADPSGNRLGLTTRIENPRS